MRNAGAGLRVTAVVVAACAGLLLVVPAGVGHAKTIRRPPPTWTPLTSSARPAAIGRIVRGSAGDGEVEIRRNGRWGAPTPLSVNGVEVNLSSVSCASTQLCGAVSNELDGRNGLPLPLGENYAFVLSDGVWVASPVVHGDFVGIDCPGSGTCITLNTARSRQLTFRDGRWELVPAQATSPVAIREHARLVCSGPNFCLSLSDVGTGEVYTDGEWKISQVRVPTLDEDVYRGDGLDLITDVACPEADLCLAVGIRSAPAGHFGPYGFASVFRDGRWSAEVRLPTASQQTLSVFCTTLRRCVIPLSRTQVLTSRTWAVIPRHAPRVPVPPRLPTLGAVSLTGTEAAPTDTVTIHAGAGAISSLELTTDANEQIFEDVPDADTSAITVTADGQPVPYTVTNGGDGFGLSFSQPEPTITLTIAPPEVSGPGVAGQPARTRETLDFEVVTTQKTTWFRDRTVALSP